MVVDAALVLAALSFYGRALWRIAAFLTDVQDRFNCLPKCLFKKFEGPGTSLSRRIFSFLPFQGLNILIQSIALSEAIPGKYVGLGFWQATYHFRQTGIL